MIKSTDQSSDTICSTQHTYACQPLAMKNNADWTVYTVTVLSDYIIGLTWFRLPGSPVWHIEKLGGAWGRGYCNTQFNGKLYDYNMQDMNGMKHSGYHIVSI